MVSDLKRTSSTQASAMLVAAIFSMAVVIFTSLRIDNADDLRMPDGLTVTLLKGDTQGCITGKQTDGTPIVACDIVRIVQ